ncbi:hypothetical protein [Dictyobacter formicarum]|uniref:DUF4129 domain-containing protein n=1 Tax=Dictyobacter formicarum TaxID=2778368 RepID=A0ABQ3VQN4_9CHLR|nr:hypothetical protein [Dictyobacter formicarum]GHO88011.1 hypothetical protein KSZ_60170 [Dictyobacter formicarum]
MPTKIAESLGSKLADQWVVTLLTPAFVFWGGGLLAWAWRFGWGPLEKWFTSLTPTVQIVVSIGALLAVVISSAVVKRFDFLMLRLLEGYWPRWPGIEKLRGRLIDRKADQCDQKEEQRNKLYQKGWDNLSREEREEYIDLENYLQYIPGRTMLLPTQLGNTLRKAESHADRYGLDTIVCWPHLWLLMPDQARQDLTEARASLDTAVRLFTWSILFLLWIGLAWWILPISFIVAFYAYRWSLLNAKSYSDLLMASIDLYRDKLYEALCWPLPTDPADEKKKGQVLTSYILRGSEQSLPRFVRNNSHANPKKKIVSASF